MREEVKITVIATGFDRKADLMHAHATAVSSTVQAPPKPQQSMPDLEIPTFLRRQR
jgi:hypothetical protein